MKVGFTGTRHGLSDSQQMSLCAWLAGGDKGICDSDLRKQKDWQITELHQGCCVGADEECVTTVVNNLPDCKIFGYPSNLKGMTSEYAVEHSHVLDHVRPPLVRNHNIVDACERLIACPEGMEEEFPRSGTWATIRYARKKDIPVTILFPDGLVQFTIKNPRPIVCWTPLA